MLVNALSPRVGGGLTYLVEVLVALERVCPELRLYVLAAPHNHELIRGSIRSEVKVVRFRGLTQRLLFEQLVLPFVRPGDVLYCPGNFCPLIRTRRPVILTLHNANYFGVGRYAGLNMRKRMETRLAHASAKTATCVIVVSRYLRDELRSEGFNGPKMHLVRSGSPRWPVSSKRPPDVDADADFILSVANDYALKHLDDVVMGWAEAFSAAHQVPQLIMVGDISASRRAFHEAMVPHDLKKYLLHLGVISERAEMKWLFEKARALVSMSELESLPLTPLEASSLGCPMILSDIPPHREVVESMATFIPLADVNELADALSRSTRRRSGIGRQAWSSTWEENAEVFGHLIDDMLSQTVDT